MVEHVHDNHTVRAFVVFTSPVTHNEVAIGILPYFLPRDGTREEIRRPGRGVAYQWHVLVVRGEPSLRRKVWHGITIVCKSGCCNQRLRQSCKGCVASTWGPKVSHLNVVAATQQIKRIQCRQRCAKANQKSNAAGIASKALTCVQLPRRLLCHIQWLPGQQGWPQLQTTAAQYP